MVNRKKDKELIAVIILSALAVLLAVILAFLLLRRGRKPSATIEEKLRLGQKYLTELDYDNAITAYAEVIEIDDRNTEAYAGLGDAYAGQEDWPAAVENYDKAIMTAADKALVEDSGDGNPDSARSGDERADVRDREERLLAVLESGSEEPVQGVLKNNLDVGYFSEIIAARDNAIESELNIIYAGGGGYKEIEDWLIKIKHPSYMPQNEEIVSLFPVDEETSRSQFDKKIRELVNEEGILPAGIDFSDNFEVSTGIGYDRFEVTEEARLRNRGLLFADIHDYDGDGSDELLIFRRYSLTDPYAYGIGDDERSGFAAEIYEAGDDGAELADIMEMGVGDSLYHAFGSSCVNVFRIDTDSGAVLYMETYLGEQDHGPDNSVICAKYRDGGFTEYQGIRYGCWSDRDSCGICFVPDSLQAFMHLSGRDAMTNNTGEDCGWKIEELPVNGVTDRPRASFEKGLLEMGLYQKLWREDHVYMEGEQYAPAAEECFSPVDGTLVNLGQYYIGQVFEGADFENGLSLFQRMWTDYQGSLDVYRREAGLSPDTYVSLLKAAKQPAEPEPDRAEIELTMEAFRIPYGSYFGGKPQGDGVLGMEMNLHEDMSYTMESSYGIFGEKQGYQYNYSGTFEIDRINADGNPVLVFHCNKGDFELTWYEENQTLDNEVFGVWFEG